MYIHVQMHIHTYMNGLGSLKYIRSCGNGTDTADCLLLPWLRGEGFRQATRDRDSSMLPQRNRPGCILRPSLMSTCNKSIFVYILLTIVTNKCPVDIYCKHKLTHSATLLYLP